MTRPLLLLLLPLLGCAHTKEADVVAVAETKQTLGAVDTMDTARLLPDGQGTPAEAQRALAELIAAHLATVGIVRAPVSADAVVAELPAPGWMLRARLVMKPELFCLVTLEPIATQPDEHAVQAAPWSVIDAFERAHRGVLSLQPPKHEPMTPDRFARLQKEAKAQAALDRPLTMVEFKRTPRPISDDPDRPYFTPPVEGETELRRSP